MLRPLLALGLLLAGCGQIPPPRLCTRPETDGGCTHHVICGPLTCPAGERAARDDDHCFRDSSACK